MVKYKLVMTGDHSFSRESEQAKKQLGLKKEFMKQINTAPTFCDTAVCLADHTSREKCELR